MTLQQILAMVVVVANNTVVVVCYLPSFREFRRYAVVLVAFSGLIWVNMNCLHDPLGLNSIVPIGVMGLPALYLLKRGNLAQLTFFVFSMFTISGLTVVWGRCLAGIFAEIGTKTYEIAAFAATTTILTAYVTAMAKCGRGLCARLFADGRTHIWALYSLYPIVALYTNNKLFYPQGVGAPIPGNMDAVRVMLSLFVFAGLVILCSAILTTQSRVISDTQLQFSRKLIDVGGDHYQKMNEMYDKLRILRHDFKYHLIAARGMLRSGEMEKVDEYLTDVEKQLESREIPKYCENAVLNALIDSYAERCRENQIPFDVKVSIPASLAVPSHDMCIIVGNLLENAVEASQRLEVGRNIALQAQGTQTQLLIMVKNSFDGAMREKDKVLVSRKADGGFGLRSVREVVSHHGGELLTESDDDTFTAYVAMGV